MERKVAVITGASGGIGAALAVELGKQGYQLALAARREVELNKTAAETGTDTIAITADVTRRQEVEALRDQALQAFGHVDVWVNNAGRGIGRKVLALTDEDVDAMISINLKSALYGMQAIIPHFQVRGQGHLINVSTFLSKVPFATYRSIYSAAKSALNVLTAQARIDLKPDYPGIHVSSVFPGVVATDFHKNALHGTPQFFGSQTISLQTPQDVALAIASLIEHPRAELYVNPAQIEVARRYCQDPEAFEQGLTAAFPSKQS